MLVELHIENIAVIQKATIPFTKGFNVFTGETGAGKTILISAIDAMLGERTSRDIIRSGEDRAVVSALFEDVSPQTIAVLEDMGFEVEDGSVLVYREMTAAGRNTCRVNGMPANVTMLKQISQHLIHIHGQRDTGQLISPEQHLQMVDDFGELEEDIKGYQKIYQQLLDKRHQLKELDMDENQKAQRLDMLGFQIEEIEQASLTDPDEEEDLLSEKKIISGAERIRKGLADASNAYLGDGELPGLEELLGIFLSGVEQAAHYMEDLESLVQRIDVVKDEISDLAGEVQSTLEELEFNPEELDAIESRLNTFYNLKRKYGSSLEEVLEFYADAVEEFESISLSDKKKAELEKEIVAVEEQATQLATQLSKKRARACKFFLEGVEKELAFLDMPDVKLSVAHERISLSFHGNDQLEFLIVTNVGEEPKPLGKIASGGELARIMLAIKSVMADKDNIDTLIFDEIDTGVSGIAAGKIGRKLAEVSKSRQVLCVTHLAQVAAFADNHLYIHKEVVDHRTYTLVDELDPEAMIRELARITSGEVITPAALETAKELKERAKDLPG